MANSDVTPDVSVSHDVINKEDIYWQVDKSVDECMVELYDKERWTDISFRCMDHVTDDPEDRLRAHKLILAARSPVFSAMFYGPNSEAGTTEVHVPEYSKAEMDAFLRFLYNDLTSMNSDQAGEVLKIAHYYQVSKLVKTSCDTISQNLTAENACHFLELSLLYEQKSLTDQIFDFIDTNVEDILKSRGFLEISRGTLEYILKGDTLFAPEITILRAVHAWAASQLTARNKEVSGRHIRELLGGAFYLVRMPVMSVANFIKLERRFWYHSYEECSDIVSHISRKVPKTLSTHVAVPRVAKTEKMVGTGSWLNSEDKNKKISKSLDFEFKEKVTVTELGIYISPFGMVESYRGTFIETPCSLPVVVTIKCNQMTFHQSKELNVDSGERQISLDPPLVTNPSTTGEYTKYTIAVEISCPTKPWMSFKPTDVTLLKYIIISRPSHRDEAHVVEFPSEQEEDDKTFFTSAMTT